MIIVFLITTDFWFDSLSKNNIFKKLKKLHFKNAQNYNNFVKLHINHKINIKDWTILLINSKINYIKIELIILITLCHLF